MVDHRVFKERVEQDYTPEPGVSGVDFRIANALEYIAYRLGRIEGHLGNIAAALGDVDLEGEASVRRSLSGLATEVSQVRRHLAKGSVGQ